MGLTLSPQKGQWELEKLHSVLLADALDLFIASTFGDREHTVVRAFCTARRVPSKIRQGLVAMGVEMYSDPPDPHKPEAADKLMAKMIYDFASNHTHKVGQTACAIVISGDNGFSMPLSSCSKKSIQVVTVSLKPTATMTAAADSGQSFDWQEFANMPPSGDRQTPELSDAPQTNREQHEPPHGHLIQSDVPVVLRQFVQHNLNRILQTYPYIRTTTNMQSAQPQ